MAYDVTIIGAGIVGLATAFQLSERRPDLRILVLEKEEAPAKHQSGNNSGVIHSGIYYQPGGSKALNCRRGYRYLIDFCDQYDVPYEICGKVIVATREEERPRLEKILSRGKANGLEGIKILPPEQVREIEPHVRSVSAIEVPQAGIISYRRVAETYADIIGKRNAEIQFNTEVHGIDRRNGTATITTSQGDFTTRMIVNCAGLYSDKITAMTMPEVQIQILPFRGEYYELIPEKRYLAKHLIYPVPNPNFPFLGVHYTRMIEGGIEAGPNAVLAFKREGYSRWDVDGQELLETLRYPGFQEIARRYWRDGLGELYRSFSKRAFVRALQHLIPEVQEADLVRGRAGVRAMACDPDGNLIDDYRVKEADLVINLCNAPSPAATASLSIGEMMAERTLQRLG
ncbi:L-2-hydroxyglutarate oxidase [Flavilitoribacter nigricans]|uniref:L-2-hydroxyglutarate oxidase n=1 Tax=Flavilitoribacter nigricans (strain ATCC 23147 / DSM 23189 / NBRC 102662 / NCIMB 1420 / SS-2) TaxID=1122177 RepID=A0A2D0N7Q5_FLAN2|nr:L-2-hydroxyglutarate oxidase [Flavilitoribacter nigricans]PHN04507.1 L-2-hydroxyglutarate oxidase [Flavilitoribacter nigricans DSM 23189 = NBRC 102662]